MSLEPPRCPVCNILLTVKYVGPACEGNEHRVFSCVNCEKVLGVIAKPREHLQSVRVGWIEYN